MKKFIDKETGKIVNLLNTEEAKKVLEMYINYCLGKREVKVGRLNLVNYLGDFIKYSNEKDIVKFYEILVKQKDSYEFSKNDMKAYEELVSFFEMYTNIEKGEFDITGIADYIININNKKENIESKMEAGKQLNFGEKLNSIFFNKDFDLSILASLTCKKWEEKMKQQLNDSEDGIDINLKEEIAYQDLLALSNGGNEEVRISADEIVEESEEHVQEDEVDKDIIVGDDPVEPVKETEPETEINSEPISKTEEVNEEEKNEEPKQEEEKEQEEVMGPIILNQLDKNETEEKKEEPKEEHHEDDEIIGSSSIREATQDVSLRDAAGFFNSAIDDLSKKR